MKRLALMALTTIILVVSFAVCTSITEPAINQSDQDFSEREIIFDRGIYIPISGEDVESLLHLVDAWIVANEDRYNIIGWQVINATQKEAASGYQGYTLPSGAAIFYTLK